MLGPRRLFTAGLAVFALASAACGAAQSPGQLIAARIVQGIGAAALTPQALVIIRAIFPPQRMGAAFGMFASGVLNTGRQLGGSLGGAVSGAVLASQLTAAMRARAVADAGALPTAARPAFGTDLARSAKAGLQVGRGQPIVPMPAGTRPPLIGQLEHLYADVFTHGYITAMGPTLAVSAALLLAGAAACLLLRRHPAPLPGADAAAGQAARAVPAATAD